MLAGRVLAEKLGVPFNTYNTPSIAAYSRRYSRRFASSYRGYRRSFRGRRRFSGGRRFSRRPRMTRMPAYLRVRSPEAKYCDQYGLAVANIVVPDPTLGFTTTRLVGFQICAVNLCQEGAANYNRLGRRIKLKSIQITGTFIPNTPQPTPSVAQPVFARFALIYDRQPNSAGTYPNPQDIWLTRDQTGASNSSLAVNWPWCPPNVDNIDRFQVLRDCKFNFATNDPAATDEVALLITNQTLVQGTQCMLYKKLRGLETHFRSNTNPSGIADISTGALYFVIWSDISGSSPYPNSTITFKWSARLRFWDAL